MTLVFHPLVPTSLTVWDNTKAIRGCLAISVEDIYTWLGVLCFCFLFFAF